MPATNLPVKSHTARSGSVLGPGVAADVANGNSFANDGNTFLLCTGGAAAKTITFVTSATLDGLAVADLTASVGISENKVFGPFPVGVYGEVVQLTHEAASTTKLTPFNISAR
jgi:hypothetical protein